MYNTSDAAKRELKGKFQEFKRNRNFVRAFRTISIIDAEDIAKAEAIAVDDLKQLASELKTIKSITALTDSIRGDVPRDFLRATMEFESDFHNRIVRVKNEIKTIKKKAKTIDARFKVINAAEQTNSESFAEAIVSLVEFSMYLEEHGATHNAITLKELTESIACNESTKAITPEEQTDADMVASVIVSWVKAKADAKVEAKVKAKVEAKVEARDLD
jgi:hypothetical protein